MSDRSSSPHGSQRSINSVISSEVRNKCADFVQRKVQSIRASVSKGNIQSQGKNAKRGKRAGVTVTVDETVLEEEEADDHPESQGDAALRPDENHSQSPDPAVSDWEPTPPQVPAAPTSPVPETPPAPTSPVPETPTAPTSPVPATPAAPTSPAPATPAAPSSPNPFREEDEEFWDSDLLAELDAKTETLAWLEETP